MPVSEQDDAPMADGDIVILRDTSSGRFHRGTRMGTGIQTHEADNLDESGEHQIVEQLPPRRRQRTALQALLHRAGG
jgi:hypothetical protein